ncbi:hypothetical protein [Limobrevibacterium gyesilva]|uniref:Uncharacterized protein n=1 Tax=Limobrevibacterium gyesilva TaxID=2991712 RepID=A0AA41YS73_9PROT|nr:hypothetical protein [Limobrevibacterium gyesilva]MCW3477885.1 hypothetical protein [Limobrevibacterium gyesilva]
MDSAVSSADMADWERLFVGSIEPPGAGLRAGGDGFVQRFSDEVQRHVIVGGVSRFSRLAPRNRTRNASQCGG